MAWIVLFGSPSSVVQERANQSDSGPAKEIAGARYKTSLASTPPQRKQVNRLGTTAEYQRKAPKSKSQSSDAVLLAAFAAGTKSVCQSSDDGRQDEEGPF